MILRIMNWYRFYEYSVFIAICILLVGCDRSDTPIRASFSITGSVELKPALAEHLAGNEHLFVIARSSDGEPVAVQPVTGLGFPLGFCIGSANLLDPAAEMPDTVRLSAVLTPSEDPFAEGFVGEVDQAVSLGTQEIHIEIPFDATKVSAMRQTPTPAERRPKDVSVSGTIEGTITLGVSPAGGIQPSDTLYIILRDTEGRMVAVSGAYKEPTFPLEYQISAENLMMGSIPSDREIVVTARLDRDKNAFSSTGDIEGKSGKRTAQVGDENVDIALDTVIQ